MLEAIRKRRSIRAYQPKEVEEEKLKEVLRAAMFSPSAHALRPWEFIVVRDRKIKDLLASLKEWAYFVNQAPLVIAVCARETRRWVEDLSIVSENIYLEATNQGLGTCFVQIRDSTTFDGKDMEERVKEILSIPKNIRVLCIMPLGYSAENPPEHSDSEFNEGKIHWEKY